MKTLVNKVDEIKALEILTRAQDLEFCRKIEEGTECLKPFWSTLESRPNIEDYSLPVQAEILLRCGSLLSYISHIKQLPNHETARQWLFESKQIFSEVGNNDKVIEVETDLGIAFWREGKWAEALQWLETASSKITNVINSVSIKNISYIILVHFAINTPESLQAGVALVQAKDMYAELSDDSRVKVHYYNNSAMLMTRVNKMTEAFKRHEKTLQFCEEVDNQYGLALAHNNIGFIYKEVKQFDLALEHANAGLTIFRNLKATARQGDCLDTLAQIYLAMGELDMALEYIDKSLGILGKFGFSKSFARNIDPQGLDYPSYINSLRTKVDILLKREEIEDALIVFGEVQNLCKKHLDKDAARSYAQYFGRAIFIQNGKSLPQETERFERRMIDQALRECGGLLKPTAKLLEISLNDLTDLLDSRFSDLREQYCPCPQASDESEEIKSFTPIKSGRKKKLPVKAHGMQEKEYRNLPVFVPNSINVAWLMPVPSPRLASTGLSEGRVAVVSQIASDKEFPTVVRRLNESGTVYFGFLVEFAGLIGLESDEYEPLTFEPDEIEVLGKIVGYCEFNDQRGCYEFFDLTLPK